MANVVNKLWSMLNMNTAEDENYEEDYNEEYYNEEDEEMEEPRGLFGARKNNKVASMNGQVKMVITQPTEFEQAQEICDLLREKKSIIINLEFVNKDVARRIIDVIGGAVHVLDGQMQKISNSIFVVVPYNYDLTSDVRDESKSKLPVGWLKGNN